jgi:hypothetical protein
MWRNPGEKLPKPKLLTDVNPLLPLVASLRNANVDMKTAQELGLSRMGDTELLFKAGRKDRI